MINADIMLVSNAIRRLRPGAEISIASDDSANTDYDNIIWHANFGTKPTEAAIVAELVNEPGTKRLTYEGFTDRLTDAEQDLMGEFVYETTPATGKPKRIKLIQALQRAVALNSIELTDPKTIAFMDILVAGGVVTQARADAILDPTL